VSYDFDVLVIGSGPAGQKAAIQAAKLERRVGIVERRHMVGGVSTNTGTIPSKTLREAVHVIRDQLQRNHVELMTGDAGFVDPHTLRVVADGGAERQVTADQVIVAVGTAPARPPNVDFDDRTMIDSDGLLHLSSIPGSLVVVGAGVIGIEYASMFAALGSKVTLVERRAHLLEFCDAEIVEGSCDEQPPVDALRGLQCRAFVMGPPGFEPGTDGL
jgi:NAD(P) transhydrogenase